MKKEMIDPAGARNQNLYQQWLQPESNARPLRHGAIAMVGDFGSRVKN